MCVNCSHVAAAAVVAQDLAHLTEVLRVLFVKVRYVQSVRIVQGTLREKSTAQATDVKLFLILNLSFSGSYTSQTAKMINVNLNVVFCCKDAPIPLFLSKSILIGVLFDAKY